MLQLKSLMRNCLLSAACRFLTTRMSKSHINIVLSSTRLRRQVDRFVNEVCAHRAQTSAKCLTSTKSYPGFESRFPDQFGFTPKMLWLHYLVGVSYFAECRKNWLLAVWEMVINLITSPISQRWWGKWKNDPESVFGTESPAKVNQLYRPSHNTKFQWNRLITFAVILQMTDKSTWSHIIYALAEVKCV